MKTTDLRAASTTPWYRQFWPWFLIVLPGTVVVAALWTLVIANQHADDLVVDEYYKEGLAINRQLERQQRAEAMGLTAQLANLDGTLSVVLGAAINEPQLRLTLSHPMESERDITLPLTHQGGGRYEVKLPVTIEGRWHWIIDAGDGSEWRLDGNTHF